jgi:hypothetical protein
MQRPRYQNGRLLRTSDFVDEQTYHLTAHRRHNTTGHVWGVAAGLDVVLLEGDLVVEPGSAVDGFGRDVILENARSLDLRSFDIRGIDAVDVWIVYDRRLVPATGDGVDLFADTASIELTDAQDVDPRQPPGVDPADLASPFGRPIPDDAARRWLIYLGTVTRDLTHPETPPIIATDRRPYIGLVGATVETPDGAAWLKLTSVPSLEVGLPGAAAGAPAPLTVRTDEVALNSGLTVDGDLVLQGGSLTLEPPAPALNAQPPVTPEWSFSHAEDAVAHELRVAMPPGSGNLSNRLVVGVWKDGNFAPSLVVDGDGTVQIAGNLVVGGRLQASSVQEAQLSPEAKAYLAGLQATSLLSLFAIIP